MKLRRNSGARNVRRQLLLQLIAAATLSGGLVMAEDSYDDILVTALVQDCCPPAAQVVPCAPGEIIMDSGTATPSAPRASGPGLDPMANAPMSSPQFDSGSQFDAPLTANAAANSFAGGATATSLASTTGTGGGLDAPNMLGDLPGVGASYTVLGSPTFEFSDPAASVRRFKISENVSPIPQDRVYFNYNHFDEAISTGAGDTYLDRYIFGGEKTFLDGLFSFEFRMAVSDGLDSNQPGDGTFPRGSEFGNLQMALKSLLYSSNSCAVGGGLTLSVPTADDIKIGAGGADAIVKNEIVYIAPFIGFLSMPSQNTFVQGFSQVDVGLGGNSVVAGGVEQGVLQDLTLMYNSISAGYWLHRDDSRNAFLNGLAAMTEIHYTTALDSGDTVDIGGNTLATPGSVDSLNSTFGLVVRKGLTNIRTAYSVPLNRNNRLYENEFLFQVNRQF